MEMSEEEIVKKTQYSIMVLNKVLNEDFYDYEEKESVKEQLSVLERFIRFIPKRKRKK